MWTGTGRPLLWPVSIKMKVWYAHGTKCGLTLASPGERPLHPLSTALLHLCPGPALSAAPASASWGRVTCASDVAAIALKPGVTAHFHRILCPPLGWDRSKCCHSHSNQKAENTSRRSGLSSLLGLPFPCDPWVTASVGGHGHGTSFPPESKAWP